MNSDSLNGDQETGYAKLNLALHVRRRLANGYHELETVFAFVDQGDLVSVSPSQSLSLEITGPFGTDLDNQENLVLQAAMILKNEFQVEAGARLSLQKNLPIASGIGGGSADAAATMRLLNRFWKLNRSHKELEDLSKPIGADVPACIASKSVIGLGIGQDMEPLIGGDGSGMHVLLANPMIEISTKEIFSKWDGIDRGALNCRSIPEVLEAGRNDLQPIATKLSDHITPLLAALANTNPVAAKMSGSGATCFGVYNSDLDAEAAKKAVQSSFDNIWTMKGRLR